MTHSNRISRTATVYLLAILAASVTLSGVRVSAAEFSLAATIEFCTNLLKGNGPVDLRGLKWIDVKDGLGNHAIALRPDSKESKLYVRDLETSDVEVISEDNIAYVSNLNRYLLARPIRVNEGTAAGEKEIVLTPSIINGRIMLSADVDQKPTEFFISPEYSSTLIRHPVNPSQFRIQMSHLPNLSVMWTDRIRVKIVPVESELPPVEYLRYLVNDRVPVGLDGVFLHDVFTHILGFQYLAAKNEWPLVKEAAQELIRFADENPKLNVAMQKKFDQATYELIVGVELASSHLSRTEQKNIYSGSALVAHLSKSKKIMSEITK